MKVCQIIPDDALFPSYNRSTNLGTLIVLAAAGYMLWKEWQQAQGTPQGQMKTTTVGTISTTGDGRVNDYIGSSASETIDAVI